MKAPADRLIGLLRELDAERKITLARAREVYGPMSEATWKRVKKRLETQGCKLRWAAKTRTFHVADPLWSMEKERTDPRLRHRLAMLRAASAALGPPYSEQLAPLFERWDANLATASDQAVDQLLLHRPQPRADSAYYERLNIIECALRDKRMLAFTYTNTTGGKTKERQIEPYALHDNVGRFYVWGRERVKQAPKFFAVDLMTNVVLEDRFEPDKSIDIDEALRHSFGIFVRQGVKPQRIVVEIDADRAAYVRARRWPAESKCKDLPDGRLRIEFAVTDAHEVVAWVLSFGGRARVVSPAAAADLARRASEDIAERHAWAKRAPKGENLLEFDWNKEA
jgi:predicted DNA-binding transcriptional regulator YafY